MAGIDGAIGDVSVLVALLLGAIAPGCAEEKIAEAPARDQTVIAAPEAYAAARLEKDLGSVGMLSTYYEDLDGDGIEELWVSSTAGAGNAGNPHFAFRKTDAGYVPLGELFMHRRGYRVLEPTVEGNVRLVVYRRLGGWLGDIVWVTSRDGVFVEEKRERVYPGDSGTEEGNRRMAEVFGEQ